jgi:hypothetical protein
LQFHPRRPSAALVVAMLALVVALGGTAFAGPVAQLAKTISGSSIKAHSIKGNRLVNNTLTGTQIKESTLATVPSAFVAGNASAANTANTATTATTATTAANAAALGGVAPSGYFPSAKVFRYSATMTKGDADKPLGTFGPFAFKASCVDNAGSTHATLTATASAAAWIDGVALAAGGSTPAFDVDSTLANSGDYTVVGGTDSGSTAAVAGPVIIAVNTGGKDCRVFGYLVNSAG